MSGQTIYLGSKAVGPGHPCYLVGEIGNTIDDRHKKPSGVDGRQRLKASDPEVDLRFRDPSDAPVFQQRIVRCGKPGPPFTGVGLRFRTMR